ncbi:MAG: hypothetical protein KJO82_05965 [Gammaproteobacteria bacterium]|nr:hypothetical protein [Gammaproteobacteria bacterium]
MNDELEKLKRDYRDVTAPPHLASRVRASLAQAPKRSGRWIPFAATAVLALVVVWLFPLRESQAPAATPLTPSLSAVATLSIQKPTGAAPSTSMLHSLTVPQMPAKPQAEPTDQQTNFNLENDMVKENKHALT